MFNVVAIITSRLPTLGTLDSMNALFLELVLTELVHICSMLHTMYAQVQVKISEKFL